MASLLPTSQLALVVFILMASSVLKRTESELCAQFSGRTPAANMFSVICITCDIASKLSIALLATTEETTEKTSQTKSGDLTAIPDVVATARRISDFLTIPSCSVKVPSLTQPSI